MSKGSVTKHVMYGEWRGYPPEEDPRLSASVRHNNYGERLAKGGPTVLSIAEGNLSTHERWHLNHLFTSTFNVLEGTVFRVTVIRYNLASSFVWMTF